MGVGGWVVVCVCVCVCVCVRVCVCVQMSKVAENVLYMMAAIVRKFFDGSVFL